MILTLQKLTYTLEEWVISIQLQVSGLAGHVKLIAQNPQEKNRNGK